MGGVDGIGRNLNLTVYTLHVGYNGFRALDKGNGHQQKHTGAVTTTWVKLMIKSH